MPHEIERKFLVASNAWRGQAEGVTYRQGYLSRRPGRTVRVRTAGAEAFLTIKGANQGNIRLEFEYAIPLSEAEEMLALCEGPLIEKTRFKIPHAGHLWEVDEFHGDNQGLIIAEVELSAEDEEVEMPEWIGAEVSGDPRYYNSNLAVHPFSRWES